VKALLLVMLLAAPARADEARTFTWPFTLDVHVLVGAELHDVGTPVAFGIGGEGLYHGWIGPFVALLASEGSPIVPTMGSAGKANPSLADRISVPIALAVRPLGPLAAQPERSGRWGWRLLAGLGLQAGVAIEHLRSSDDEATTAGLHLGLNLDVPLYGGPLTGGIALRLYARLIWTPSVTLSTGAIAEPAANGQLFAGICYTP
jgi:hypothetical protein